MRILFVYDALYRVGGIQTLLVRLSRRLVAQGHQVDVLTRPRLYPDDDTNEIIEALTPYATLFFAEHRYMRPASAGFSALNIQSPDVVVCCSLPALLLTLSVRDRRLRGAALLVGVFHPREYCWERTRQGVDGRLSRRVLSTLSPSSIFFTTVGMARQMGGCMGRDFDAAPVLPLAVEIPGQQHERPASQRIRIVSITRTTRYYPIHWHLLNVIETLTAAGHDVEYHAYGTGEELEDLRREVRTRELTGRVSFLGALEHSRMSDVLADAFAYIGLGTSLLEAAAHGVPSLVAVDCSPTATTYGYFHEAPGQDLGGYVPELQEYDIRERLEWLIGVGADTYAAVARACAERAASEFSLDRYVSRFLAVAEQAESSDARISRSARAAAWCDWMLWRLLTKIGFRDSRSTRYSQLTRQPPPAGS